MKVPFSWAVPTTVASDCCCSCLRYPTAHFDLDKLALQIMGDAT
jgi:hypothetical protein